MLAEQFIDRLEQQGLLDAKVVQQLRRKLSKVKDRKKITAEQIARLLVDAGHLTQFQATKLVAELTAPSDSSAVQVGATREVGSADELAIKPSNENMDLDIQDVPQRKSRSEKFRAAPTPPPAPAAADDLLEELVDANPLGDAGAGLGGLDPALTGGAAASPPGGVVRQRGPAPLTAAPTSVWDSKLLLIGGGVLGTMVVVGFFLYLALTRGKADELFEQAQKAYKDGAYAQAAKLYEQLLEDYPRHPSTGIARVKVVTAKLRQTYRTPAEGLRVAKEEIPKIQNEEAFDKARPELAAMLPDIAAGFVNAALKATDITKKEQLLKQAEEAMKLVNNPEYIPTSLRQSRLGQIRETIENMKRVEREIYSDRELRKAVAAIEAAAEEGETQRAYEIRHELLVNYPGLAGHELLIEALKKVTSRERGLVHVVRKNIPAKTDDRPGTDAVRVILAGKRGQTVGGVAKQVVPVQVKGTVFALDAATGNVLWSRYVGTEYTGQPTPLDENEPGSDLLVVDGRYHELLRLDAYTGKLVWRLELEQPFAAPVPADGLIYVARRDGRIYQVDAETGTVRQYTQLPMPTRLPPDVDRRRKRVFQVGHHDNLYVLDSETMECVGVSYIGHKPGTVPVPPIVVLGHLFVPEQLSDQVSLVHVLRLEDDNATLKVVQPPLRLQGRIRVKLFASRRRVLFVTDLGAIHLYDVDLNSPERPIIEAASQPAHFLESTIAFPLFESGYLWLGERRLIKYQVQTSTGKLPRQWVALEGDQVMAPILKRGEVLYVIRRRKGMSAITVAAIPMSGKQPRWEIDLAGGASYVAAGAKNQVEILTPTGQLFRLDPTNAQPGTMVAPVVAIDLQDAAAVHTSVDNRDVFTAPSGYREVAVLDRNAQPPLRKVELNITRGQATAPGTGYQSGLLVPLATGEVALLDLKAGIPIVDPFHPPVAAGAKVKWGRPAVFPDGKEFVIADNRRQLFKVGLKDRPRRNLAELVLAEPESNLEPQLATTQDHVYGVIRTGGADSVMVYSRASLAQVAEIPLEGRVVWGPQTVGGQVYLATGDQIAAIAGNSLAWTADSPAGPLVGQPVPLGNQLVVAFQGGQVAWLEPSNGQIVKTVASAEPLASSPVVVGDRVAVIGHGGNLLLLQVPTGMASTVPRATFAHSRAEARP